MNIATAVLTIAMALTSQPIYSVGDLKCEIQYVDKQNGYFLAIEKTRFSIGTALNSVTSSANDMPQISGHVEDCSSREFRCRSIAYLVFAIPNGSVDKAIYTAGPRIIIKRMADGGWQGSAACSRFTKSGCAALVDVGRPAVTYRYHISPSGVLDSIQIKNWNEMGAMVSAQNMNLLTKVGLVLN